MLLTLRHALNLTLTLTLTLTLALTVTSRFSRRGSQHGSVTAAQHGHTVPASLGSVRDRDRDRVKGRVGVRGRARVRAKQHAVRTAPLAVPHLGSCASLARAWRLWAVRHSHGEADVLSTQPPPRLPEPAAS